MKQKDAQKLTELYAIAHCLTDALEKMFDIQTGKLLPVTKEQIHEIKDLTRKTNAVANSIGSVWDGRE